jgi:hypothetical protein
MSVEKEIRKILGEATPAASRAKQELVRSGLGHDKNMAATMAALKDPEEAMKSPAKRELLLKVMQDLLDVVVNDPSMVMKTKTALRKEDVEESAEDIQEKLVGGQKKLDKNKNGKLDAEDFKKLRGESKKDKEDEEEDEEDEDEKEMEDDEEEDEVELSKDQVDKMIAAMKKTKGFKAHIKTLKGAEEGFVSHAQRKAVWASRNDAKEAMKRKAKKTTKEETQIDELKRSTLASYAGKASKEVAKSQSYAAKFKKDSEFERDVGHPSRARVLDKERDVELKHAKKRQAGFDKALGRLAKEEVQLEQAPVAPAPVKHRIAVTVSEPDHPMVTKRKEQVLKYVVVSHGPDKAGAQKVGEKFYKKKGYKVHGSEHAGLKEGVNESDNKTQYAIKHKMSKKILSTHKDLASAKDEWKGIDKNERPFYQVVSHSKPAKNFSMKESVTTDYSKIAGQSQNKTPTQKLATDYKLATKKTQKEEVQIDELDTSTVKSYLDKVRFKQARSAVQANMGTPGMKKKHSAELEKTAKSMETAKKRLTKEEVQIDEAGPFSYGKPPRKGSVADLAAKKRKEQEKGKMPIEPKDQMVGNAKVVKEAFPTVDDAKKRMKDALKSNFEKKKISTGTVYTRKYKEEPEDEKKSDK